MVAIAPAELESAFSEGIGFDGSAIEGFARIYEADMLAKPDPSTFQVLPWRGERPGTARMFCDITLPDGSPSRSDARHVLRRALDHASDLGFSFYTHPEIEFFLLRRGELGGQPEPIDQAGYFDHVPNGTGHDFRRAAITMLESVGISVEFSHHEGGPGQNEIDLRYADALATADNIMTFRSVVKEVAIEQGVYATFMPKPFAERTGSGLHLHLSLTSAGNPVFPNAADDDERGLGLSAQAYGFVGGILEHAPALQAVMAPTVNSYKRTGATATRSGASWAPRVPTYGGNDRTHYVRIPDEQRVELRGGDGSANPYLAVAALLGAGLDGIKRSLDPGAVGNCPGHIAELPLTLLHAVEALEADGVVAGTLDAALPEDWPEDEQRVSAYFAGLKRDEFFDWHAAVTPWEVDKYLTAF